MDWAPDGCALAVVNSFQSPNHTCVVLGRGCWERAPEPLTSLVRRGAPAMPVAPRAMPKAAPCTFELGACGMKPPLRRWW